MPRIADQTKEADSKPAAPEKSGSAVPSISLPKGGGAIQGIGEKFAMNPVTGTASFSIPIFASPGRADFGPKLTLSYDSGAGNGPFGLGWHLGIPSIIRKTSKGLPQYRDRDESDVFLISDAEDLVPELVPEGPRWVKNDRVEEVEGQRFEVRRYRPRIEGLFARIERWRNAASGETHWRSISRDNVTSLYGRTPEARIADPENPDRVFQWMLERSWDDKGNAIVYLYKREELPSGRRRLSDRHRSETQPNLYLERILYGNRTPRFVTRETLDIVADRDPKAWL
ncbi:MAG TPA: SpvB/TcaC N-terminal domain-containing protein, partial [Blastocatellia bacterium]|nr:SpvB/TcaC N-terminal domain-containing protein [Blastocatellia bacterium]